MQKHIELLCRAEIERANKNGELIGRNPDVGRLIDFFASGDGLWGHKHVEGIDAQVTLACATLMRFLRRQMQRVRQCAPGI
jgi:hypothetical protein